MEQITRSELRKNIMTILYQINLYTINKIEFDIEDVIKEVNPIDNEFVIHDIKVIEGEKGMFIAMPSKKGADGAYRDIAHPINSDTRENLQRIILEAYEKQEG